MSEKTIKKQKYKNLPPEGGWGYLIGISMALSFAVAVGSMPSLGLMFGDFLSSLGEETSAISLITSCFFSALSFAGLFTNILYKKFSCRSVGLAGGFLFLIGSFLTIFVKSLFQLIFCYSVLRGFGYGLIISTAYTTFNDYFIKRRVMVMSFAQAFMALGGMIYPILVEKLMSIYGFRGSMAILAAVNGHVILFMLIMHPVEWHMKKVKVDVEEEDDLFIEKVELEIVEERGTRTIFKRFVDFLDLTLLKDLIYVNIVCGISLATYSDIAFFTILPVYLISIGFSMESASQILAFGSLFDLLSGVFLGISSICFQLKARHVYLGGVILTIASRFVFLNISEFTSMAIIAAIMGFLRTFLYAPLPLCFAEYLPRERFPSGYGLYMFLQGNIMLIIGPLVGYIRDTTKSYEISFQLLSLLMGLCAVPWLIEITFFKLKKKQPLFN